MWQTVGPKGASLTPEEAGASEREEAPWAWALAGASLTAVAMWALLAEHVLWRTAPERAWIARLLGLLVTAGVALAAGLLARRRGRSWITALRDAVGGEPAPAERALPEKLEKLSRAVTARPLAAAVAVTALLSALTWIVHVPVLEIDDVLYWMIVAGFGVSPVPDEHIWVNHFIPGQALAALYRTSPGGPWYGLFVAVPALAGEAAILYALIRKLGAPGLLLGVLQYFVLDLFFIAHLQHTMVSARVALAGVLLVLVAADATTQRERLALLAGTVALFVTATFVRPDPLWLVLALGAPALGVATLVHGRTAVVPIAGVVLGAAVSFGLVKLDRAYYANDPVWRDFSPGFHPLRQPLIEGRVPIVYDDTTRPFFEALGWTEDDLFLLHSWFYVDDETFTDEKLRAVTARFPRPWTPLAHVWQQLGWIGADERVAGTAALALLLLVGLSRRGFVVAAGSAAAALILLVYLLNFEKAPPDRVYLPAIAALLTLTAAHADPRRILPAPVVRGRYGRNNARWILVVLALATGAGAIARASRAGHAAREGNHALKADLARLAPRPEQLYVVWGDQFPYEHLLPFEDPAWARDLKLLQAGALHTTPINAAQRRAHGVGDIYRALVERAEVFLIAGEAHARRLARAIERHRGLTVDPVCVLRAQGWSVFRMVRRR